MGALLIFCPYPVKMLTKEPRLQISPFRPTRIASEAGKECYVFFQKRQAHSGENS